MQQVDTIALISRILMRYLAPILGLWAGVPEEVWREVIGDPDIILIVTVMLGLVIEALTVVARRRGWFT